MLAQVGILVDLQLKLLAEACPYGGVQQRTGLSAIRR